MLDDGRPVTASDIAESPKLIGHNFNSSNQCVANLVNHEPHPLQKNCLAQPV